MNFTAFLRVGGFVALSFVPLAAHAQMAPMPVSGMNSTITVMPAQVSADGSQRVSVTVQARDRYDHFVPSKRVEISVSSEQAIVIPLSPTTDSMGRATFAVKTSVVGEVIVSAKIDGIEVHVNKSISFVQPPVCALDGLELIKIADDGDESTEADYQVYYYGLDCKRHPFPGNAFDSWYPEGTNVSTISAEVMASIRLGTNVDHKLGTLIRFQSDKRVYSAKRGGVIQEVKEVDPAKEVDVLSDALYISYSVGIVDN